MMSSNSNSNNKKRFLESGDDDNHEVVHGSNRNKGKSEDETSHRGKRSRPEDTPTAPMAGSVLVSAGGNSHRNSSNSHSSHSHSTNSTHQATKEWQDKVESRKKRFANN
jgi:hypothetical protein